MNYQVLFDDRRAVFAPTTGIGIYARLILQALSGQDTVQVSRTSVVAGRVARSGIASPARIGKLAADQLLLPWKARSADLYHAVWYEISPLLRTPLVLTLQDLSIREDPASYSGFQRHYYGSLLALIARRARVIIVPSEDTETRVRDWLPTARTRIVRNPLDPVFLARDISVREDPEDSTDPYVLYAGGFHSRKDLPTLFGGMALGQRRGAGVTLAATGNVPEGVRTLAADLGCQVRWLGPVPSESMPALYTGARAVVSASVQEGFSYPAAEAAACGRCFVCPDEGVSQHTAGPAAVTFSAGDRDSFAEGLAAALSEGNDARAGAGREWARSRYSLEHFARSLVSCYETALE